LKRPRRRAWKRNGRFAVQDYLYKALLCRFVIDAKKGETRDVMASISRYTEIYPQFANHRECKLIQALMKAFNDDDPKKFTDILFNFDKVTKLDDWSTKMLVQVKRVLKDGVQPSAASDEPGSAVDLLLGPSRAKPTASAGAGAGVGAGAGSGAVAGVSPTAAARFESKESKERTSDSGSLGLGLEPDGALGAGVSVPAPVKVEEARVKHQSCSIFS